MVREVFAASHRLLDPSVETLSRITGKRPVSCRAPSWMSIAWTAMLEKLVQYIKGKPGVWFATHEQIAIHVKPLIAAK